MMIRILLLSSFITTVLSACNTGESDTHTEHNSSHSHTGHGGVPTLIVSNPLRKDITTSKEYVAQIHAYRHIELRAIESGYLQDIFVDEGQSVEKGQAMFKIMPTLYEVELEKARAEANIIDIEYKNAKALAQKNVISENELAVVKAKLKKAYVEVKRAQTHLDFTDINAPFDGIMDHLDVRNGSLLEEGELLTKLSDISKMWVYFNVPEAEYIDYQTHQSKANLKTVHLRMANNKLFQHTGKIETIEADFDNTTGNIQFRATFPNPEKLLRHGQTGVVLIDIPHKDVLVIPQKATFEILDKTYVYTVDNESKLHQKSIVIEAELPHIFLVSSGVDENDRILVNGLRKVHNGQQIHADFKSPNDVLANLELHAE